MKRLMIMLTIAVALGLQTQSAQSADASSVWNMYAAEYSFSTTNGAMMGATFAQAYRGSGFESDFAGILNAVAEAMGTNPPPFGGGDVMNASLENWPD